MPRCSFITTRRVAAVFVASTMAGLAACAAGEKKADSAAAVAAANASPAAASTDPMGASKAGAMPGMPAMTGDADHDFLRMMSDHHKGLIEIVHMTQDKKDIGSASRDATKLDTKQDRELDHMMTMLEKDYKDAYAPKILAEHQRMIDDLKTKAGKEYVRTFYQDIIKHHQEALKMIDGYLPNAKNAMLKGMAQTMKTDQAKEIREFQQKVAKLGT